MIESITNETIEESVIEIISKTMDWMNKYKINENHQ